jgi:hypothetical protein
VTAEQENQFVQQMLPYARQASQATGVHVPVILAQWGDETGWGTSELWSNDHNLAGVEGASGLLLHCGSIEEGVQGYIACMNQDHYTSVREAQGWQAQTVALGQSHWDGGHYNLHGAGPGTALIGIVGDFNLTQYDTGGPGDVAASPTLAPKAGQHGSAELIRVPIDANLQMAGTVGSIAAELGGVRLRLVGTASGVAAPPSQVPGLVDQLEGLIGQLGAVVSDLAHQSNAVRSNSEKLRSSDAKTVTPYAATGKNVKWPDLEWDAEFSGKVPGFLKPLVEWMDTMAAERVTLPRSRFSAPSGPATMPKAPSSPHYSPPPPPRVPAQQGDVRVTSTAGPGVTMSEESARLGSQQISWSGTREGQVLLQGSSWLGGKGVEVRSDNGTGYGGQYQCVDLPVALYQHNGWIHGGWHGNGNSMLQNPPSGVEAQLNSEGSSSMSVSHLAPGDVVSMNVYHNGAPWDEYGHVAVVNQVIKCSDGDLVQLVNQNAPSVYSYATLSPKSVLTVAPQGTWTYPIVGVGHAVANTG